MKIQRAFRLSLPAIFVFSLTISVSPAMPGYSQAQEESRTFPQTGKTVWGRFLDYWNEHGGLAQQGYPISDEFLEVSDTNHLTYTVQYFERAVFELHPENQAPNDVLLSLLGNFLYQKKYPNGAPNQQPNFDQSSVQFTETGKRLGGKFRDYWEKNGGLVQQGLPISDEFVEKSDLDGKEYLVQYFERAVFEMHPENQAPYDVLLSQLGTFQLKNKYPTGAPAPLPTRTPTSPSPLPLPKKITPVEGTVFRVYPRVATFRWEPVEPTSGRAVTYGIEIQVNAGFWQRFEYKPALITTTHTMQPFAGDNQGRWRVWATNTGLDPGPTGWTGFSFNTSAAQYSGTWLRAGEYTKGITRLEISNEGQSISVHGFEKCQPTDCDWGTRTATFNGEPFTILFDFGRGGTHQLSITLDDPAGEELKVLDESSVSDRVTYHFTKQP
jgi:hypothetical protein